MLTDARTAGKDRSTRTRTGSSAAVPTGNQAEAGKGSAATWTAGWTLKAKGTTADLYQGEAMKGRTRAAKLTGALAEKGYCKAVELTGVLTMVMCGPKNDCYHRGRVPKSRWSGEERHATMGGAGV